MNIVEFAIKFKDLASSELGKFGAKSRETFSKAEQYAKKLSENSRVVGQSYDEIQRKIKQVENTIRTSTIPSKIREARKELEQLQRQSKHHLGNPDRKSGLKNMLTTAGLGSMAKFAGPAAIGAAVLGTGKFIGSSVSNAMERQKVQTSFNVLTGSKEAGGALTKELVDLQKNTILGGEVFKQAQTMMAFGASSTEVAKELKILGDITMGDTERMNSLVLAFSQSRSAGRLMGQDLLQMVNAGFNPLQVMSEKTGKSMEQLRDEMGDGNISFDMVKQAFIDATSEGGKFNNMLAKIAEEPAGKMEKLKGEWGELKTNVGMALMPLMETLINFGSRMMPVVESVIEPLTKGIETAVNWMRSLTSETGGWSNYIATIKELFANGIFPFVQKVLGAVIHIVAKLIEWYGKSQLIQDLFQGISLLFSGILNMIGGLIDGVVWLFDNIVMPILNAIEKVYEWIKGGGSINVVPKKPKDTAPVLSTSGDTNTELLRQAVKNTGENASAAKNTGKEISGGGPKTINITVQKFLDAINVNTTNLREGTAEIEAIVLEMFGRIVTQGARAM